MSIFLYQHRNFLEDLRKQSRSNPGDISEAVAEAERILAAERELYRKLRMR